MDQYWRAQALEHELLVDGFSCHGVSDCDDVVGVQGVDERGRPENLDRPPGERFMGTPMVCQEAQDVVSRLDRIDRLNHIEDLASMAAGADDHQRSQTGPYLCIAATVDLCIAAAI